MVPGFREIVAADFEFAAVPGERPDPVSVVAYELISGRRFRIFRGQFPRSPPLATGPDVLFVAYFSSAELGCYRALGWPMPERVLDLYVEFRWLTCGLAAPGAKLINVLAYFGSDTIGAEEKAALQEAIGSNTWSGRYTHEEILNYNETDVAALGRLLPAMLPHLDLPRALLRGR